MTSKRLDFKLHRTKNIPLVWHDPDKRGLWRYTMRAFATVQRQGKPHVITLTVCDRTPRGCRDRLRAICRDYRLPLKRTLDTARVIRYPSSMR